MFFEMVVAQLKGLYSASRTDSIPGLTAKEQFRGSLERERGRADRSGYVFSLISFTVQDTDSLDRTRALVRILRNRLRTTDEIGWLDARRIGAILPDTSADWAWKVAEDVLRQFPKEYTRPICEVFCYPSDRIAPSGPDQPGRRSREATTGQTQRMEPMFAQAMPLWKRSIDVVGASIALIVFGPIILGSALLIRLGDRGPAFFTQQRMGLGGKRFTMFKLRTMRIDADAQKITLMKHNEVDGPAFKMTNDPRVTPFGRFLRQTSIDELPQLWNVLTGDMSLVGPRPLPCAESDACSSWQQQRLDVTPGLTCIWQVSGRSLVSFVDWVRMDVRYIRNRSLRKDVNLLAKTIPAVMRRKGAY